jgi:hypothetical protein
MGLSWLQGSAIPQQREGPGKDQLSEKSHSAFCLPDPAHTILTVFFCLVLGDFCGVFQFVLSPVLGLVCPRQVGPEEPL